MSQNPLFPMGTPNGWYQPNPHNQVIPQQSGQVASQATFALSPEQVQGFTNSRTFNAQVEAQASSMSYSPSPGKVRPGSQVANNQQNENPPGTDPDVNGCPIVSLKSSQSFIPHGQQIQNTQWLPNAASGDYAGGYGQQMTIQSPYCPQSQPQAPTQYLNGIADSSNYGLDGNYDGQHNGTLRPSGTQQVHPGSAFMPVTATGFHNGLVSSGNNSYVNGSMMPPATAQLSNDQLNEVIQHYKALQLKSQSQVLSATEDQELRNLLIYLKWVSASRNLGEQQGERRRTAASTPHHGSSPMGRPSNSARPQTPAPAQPKSNDNTDGMNVAQLNSRWQELSKKSNTEEGLTSPELAEGNRLTALLSDFQTKQMQVKGQIGERALTSNSLQNLSLPNAKPAQYTTQQTPSSLPQNAENQQTCPAAINNAKIRFEDLWKKHRTEGLTPADKREVQTLKTFLGKNNSLPQNLTQRASGIQAVQNGLRAAPSQAVRHQAHALERRDPKTAALPYSLQDAGDNDDELVCLGQIPRTQPPQNHNEVLAPHRPYLSLHQRRLNQGVQQQRNGNNVPQSGMSQTSQASIMPRNNQNNGQGKVHPSGNIQNNVSPTQQQSASIAPMIAGQKRCLDSTEVDSERDADHPSKRARISATPQVEPQQNKDLVTAQNSSMKSNAVGPTVTLPIGNLDPALTVRQLGAVIATFQAGGRIQQVRAGRDILPMPPRSVLVLQPQGSSLAYVGRSDIKDIGQWDKLATPSFHEALRIAKDHEHLVNAGVPPENAKIAVFDDRQMKVVPVSEVENRSNVETYASDQEVTFSERVCQTTANKDIAPGADLDQASSFEDAVTTPLEAVNDASQNDLFGETRSFQAQKTQLSLQSGVTAANPPRFSSPAAAAIPIQAANKASKSESPEEKPSCQAQTTQSSPKSSVKAPSLSAEDSRGSTTSANQTKDEPQSPVPWVPTFKEVEDRAAAEREAAQFERLTKACEEHNKAVDAGWTQGILPSRMHELEGDDDDDDPNWWREMKFEEFEDKDTK